MILQISASAGSGKTYTLTRHFLELLMQADITARPSGCALHGSMGGFSLAEILAATFTNKAAAEMRQRVLQGLKNQALADRAASRGKSEATSRDKSARKGRAEAWVETILRHYGHLNIRTIDSLLTTLVRLSALQLDLAPDFQPAFDPAEYFNPVYDGLMEDLAVDADDAGAEYPALEYPGAGDADSRPGFFTSDAAHLRASLRQSCRSLLMQGALAGFGPKDRLRGLVQELTERSLRGEATPETDTGAVYARAGALHGDMTRACHTMLTLIEQQALKTNQHFFRYLNNCAAVPLLSPPPKSVYADKDSLDDCLNAASRGNAPETAHAAFASAVATVKRYGRALPLFRHALYLAPLAALATEIVPRIRHNARDAGIVPAPLLPALAGQALGGENGVSDALCRLGTRLSRLLLDEFQDTSREQWAAILPLAVECLSTGGSLTYVGDVKQAIYGWRGGDARLFDEPVLDPELTAIAPKTHRENLPCNWRSHPAVVTVNNAFFAQLTDEGPARNVLAAMLPPETPQRFIEQAGHEAARNFASVCQAVPPEKNWADDPRGPLAGVCLYEVEGGNTEAVRAMVKSRLRVLFFEELLPAWTYGDIALLVRSGDEGSLIAAWLTEWGLPVVTENSFQLAAHPLISRLTAFLSFLDYPPDDAALLEFLQAEFLAEYAELPDAGVLHAWAAACTREHGTQRPPLYRLLRRDFPAVWAGLIEPFFSQAGLMSAYDTLREIVRRFGLLERLPGQAAFLRRLLELAQLAETRGHSSLAAFLAFWRDCKDNEKLPLPENMDAVRVMTIHKAKGLEFPVVVLPFQHKARRTEAKITVAECEGLPLLTRAGPELEDHFYPACVTDELERLNLLYVAWTRPVYALHAFITRPRSTSTALTRGLEVMLDSFRQQKATGLRRWECLNDDDEEAGETEAAISAAAPASTAAAPEAAAPEAPLPETSPGTLPLPPAPWRPMDWLPRLRIFRSPLDAAPFSPRRRGILIHSCLEHLHLSGGPETWQDAVRRAVHQALRLFHLPLARPDDLALDAMDALYWFVRQPQVPDWLAHGRREQSIMDAQGRLHRLDLLVDGADLPGAAGNAPLVCIDYKTGEEGEAKVAHEAQVRRYLDLLRAATGRPATGRIVYLDLKRLVRVEDTGGPGS